jgi:hypothetical protein
VTIEAKTNSMIEAIIPDIFIDLAMGILLFGSIALFHCATSQMFIVGIKFPSI